MSAAGISVVTTTWNERENIKNLILSARAVLKDFPHEIIVVDDDSSDGTIQVAKRYADVAMTKKREGQTISLLYGMHRARVRVPKPIMHSVVSSRCPWGTTKPLFGRPDSLSYYVHTCTPRTALPTFAFTTYILRLFTAMYVVMFS